MSERARERVSEGEAARARQRGTRRHSVRVVDAHAARGLTAGRQPRGAHPRHGHHGTSCPGTLRHGHQESARQRERQRHTHTHEAASKQRPSTIDLRCCCCFCFFVVAPSSQLPRSRSLSLARLPHCRSTHARRPIHAVEGRTSVVVVVAVRLWFGGRGAAWSTRAPPCATS